jgi:serine/threonine protein kinase
LEYAHGRGVIHRDIKPANLLLDLTATVKILDMGLARFSDAANVGNQAELTGTGMIMGTVDYMSPEQAVSTKTADARSDIYSLGISLFFLLTGKPAYPGDSLMGRMLAHREQPIPVLSQRRSDVSPSLDAVFAKMVAKTADQRYQTMTEVISDLEACRSGGSVIVMTAAAPITGTDSSTEWSDFVQTLDSGEGAVQAAAIPAVTATSPQSHPQPASETLSSSAGQDTLGQKTKPRSSPQKSAVREKQKLLIGGTVVGMLLLGLLIWAFSGGETPKENGSNSAAKSKSSDGPPLAVAPLDTRQAKSHQQAWAKHLGVPVDKKVDLPGGAR